MTKDKTHQKTSTPSVNHTKKSIPKTSQQKKMERIPLQPSIDNNFPMDQPQNKNDNYFQKLTEQKARKTSSNSISSLPTLDIKEIREILRLDQQQKFHTQLDELDKCYRRLWPQWKFQLEMKFNLIFFGFGSKKLHLERFVKDSFADHHIFVINGFFPTGQMRDLVCYVEEKMSNASANGIDSGKKEMENCLILFHNLDGECFRNSDSQLELASFLSVHHVKFIATVDHVNAAILWDFSLLEKSNFIFQELTTFADYIEETSFENSFLVKSQGLGLRGLRHVLKSLTSNAISLFKLLIKHQIEAAHLTPNDTTAGIDESPDDNDNEVGIPHHTLYLKGREEFIVGNENIFKTILTEFFDHKIILTKKRASDGSEILWIPLDKSSLLQIMKDIE